MERYLTPHELYDLLYEHATDVLEFQAEMPDWNGTEKQVLTWLGYTV